MSNPLAATLKDIIDEALDQLDISRGDEQVSLSDFRRVLKAARASSSSIDKSRPNFYEVTIRNQDTHDRFRNVILPSLRDYVSDNKIHLAGMRASGGATNRFTIDDLMRRLIDLAIALGTDNATNIFIDSLESSVCSFGNYALLGGITIAEPIHVFDGVSMTSIPNTVQTWPDDSPTFLPDSELLHRFRNAAIFEEQWTLSPRFIRPEDYVEGISQSPADSPIAERAKSKQAPDFDPYLFCTALSLVVMHKVYVSIRWRSMPDDELINLHGITSYRYETVQSPENRVHVTADQVEDAKKLYYLIKRAKAKTLRQLLIPTSRLIESTSREQLVDRIIDLAIALESLYLPDEDTELGFRLRLRAAKHMEESFDGRRATAHRIRAFYKARSDAVHTGRVRNEYQMTKKESVPILDLTTSVQDVCRKSIIKILTDRKMPDWTRLDYEGS